MLAKMNEGGVCFSDFVSESGKANAYNGPTFLSLWVKQRTSKSHQQPQLHNNPTSFSTLRVLVRGSFVLEGGDLLEVQPGHSNGPRKLWNAGALMRVIHLLRAFIQLVSSSK